MSMELTELTNGHHSDEGKDTLFLLGGVAMVVFGAGLILSTPIARQFLGGLGIGNLLGGGIPKDIERYMKLRSM
jgi:hypothetical protein